MATPIIEPKPVKMQEVRKRQKMTKNALGWKSGVNCSTVGKIEAGRYIPYDAEITRIAEALGVPYEERYSLLEPLEVNR